MEEATQLPRPSMNDVFKMNSSTNRNSRVQRVINSLKWRQQHQTSDTYPYTFEDGRDVTFQQINNGELKGLGTGAVVWPAAHVLSKYLELHYSSKLSQMRVCDVGCGTGFVGILAAMMGADVTLTDLDCVASVINTNMSSVRRICPSLRCNFQCYDWDASADHLNPPFDLILVSDCVLPKLYPIEPLVLAVARLMNDNSIALFSYEQRMYPYFDPREEFTRLAAIYGLHVSTIPLSEHHSFYCSDEIELWCVTRTPLDQETPVLSLSCFGAVDSIEVNACGLRWSVEQRVKGDIGCCVWASSVIASRYLLGQPKVALEGGKRPTALDLGAGCGLAAMALCLSGYDVVAVDKTSVMDVLRSNVAEFQTHVGINMGRVDCCEFDWMKYTNDEMNCLQERAYDAILLSDCFYESFSVAPVLQVLDKVAGESTQLIIANELRTAFDEFLTSIRRSGWKTEEITLSRDDLCVVHNSPSAHYRPIRLLTATYEANKV